MKELKICKMNMQGIIKASVVFYGVFITMQALLVYSIADGSGSMSGMEMMSVIFLFICGLNSFKSNFFFAKANSVSRRAFLRGIALSILPIAFVTSVIDIIVNRITNIFVTCSTIYDMSFGSLIGKDIIGGAYEFIQPNDIGTIVNSILCIIVMKIAFYMLGLLITMTFYRCNKIMKLVVAISPIIIINAISILFPKVWYKIGEIASSLTGSINMYYLTSIVMAVIYYIICYLLIRNAVVKDK